MGHTKKDQLLDLEVSFKEIRSLDGVKEKTPGIFYLKTIPFLHFHDKDGKRWADVKTLDGWVTVDIDFNASAKTKSNFIKTAKLAYAKLIEGKIKK